MRVAVIGAGVVGISTAYFSALNGHQVTVIEQRGNVAEEASLGHAGLLGPAHLGPMAAPGMPRRLISRLTRPNSPAQWHPGGNLAHWRWLRRWLRECQAERFISNTETIQRLGTYSQQLLQEFGLHHSLDFQQRSGVLELFRTEKDLLHIAPGLELLSRSNLPFQQLDAAACHELEPALSAIPSLHGGLFYPQDGSGNCALFTKQVKTILQQMEVQFNFLQRCDAIIPQANGFSLQLTQEVETEQPREHSGVQLRDHFSKQQTQQHFDAVVVAAGTNGTHFLNTLGIAAPLSSFQSFSSTAAIKNLEGTPELSIIDDTYQVAITRMDKRIRLAGTSQLGRQKDSVNQRAWQTLRSSATDWFPNAANYHSAQCWNSHHLMMPDGAPVIGRSPVKQLYVNLAHAENGWGLAMGSGKIIADQLSGRSADIELTGLTLDDR